MTGLSYASLLRNGADRQLAEGLIGPRDRANLHAAAEFCERHGVTVGLGSVNLWGFGTATTFFEMPEGGWWVPLHELADPFGLSFAELKTCYYDDRGEEWESHRADSLAMWTTAGEREDLRLVSHSFALMVLTAHSPWAREFMDNSLDMFRHAAVKSDLAGLLGSAQLVEMRGGQATATGSTLSDWFNDRDLSSEDAARDQAFRGPSISSRG